MATALGGLKWTPDTFWRATMAELKAAVAGARRGAVLEEDEIGQLREMIARSCERERHGL